MGIPGFRFLFDDGHQRTGDDGNVNLGRYCVFSPASEGLDLEVLLDSLEGEFHLPAAVGSSN